MPYISEMTPSTLSIGDLARLTGCKVQTIRWYESEGLLPKPARTAGGHRIYSRTQLEQLDFIRHAREFGFSLEAIRTLLDLAARPDQPSCEEAHRIASAELGKVEDKLRRLETLRAELARLVENSCRGAPADCRVLATLSDHSQMRCVDAGHSTQV